MRNAPLAALTVAVMRWSATYATDLKGGAGGTAEDLAKQAIKQLKKAHVLK